MLVYIKLDKPDSLDKINGPILHAPKSRALFKV